MNRTERIAAALKEKFRPTHLELIDESSRHAEHIEGGDGTQPVRRSLGEGGTHYQLVMESAAFAGMSKVKRHQAIYALLNDEFKGGLHAFAITAYAPGER